ncbi:MAG: guanylate kinase [Armatimonadetes bacterium]|nr:guanylate kinase [Armatimonadota bacterium]
MRGSLVLLSGPSGVGKDAILDALIARDPRIHRVVTYTTRQPRAGEQNGVDYHFVSLNRFFELAQAGHFFEYMNVFADDWYASPRTDAERMESEGKIAVLKIDVEGANEVRRQRPDALSIIILPPSMEELERRIRARGGDDEASIQRRLAKANWELGFADRYTHQVVNDDLQSATETVYGLIAS